MAKKPSKPLPWLHMDADEEMAEDMPKPGKAMPKKAKKPAPKTKPPKRKK